MKKVLVGLSGGVDSAIAAYLLKKEGYDVTCAFMRNWDSMANDDFEGNPTINDAVCPQEADYKDAQDVADKLGLPLLRVDFIKEYWDEVFKTFLEEYKRGRTPNPDILCNRYIKFDSFMKFAKEKGFDTVATGHYCKLGEENGIHVLQKADDRNKDQSYFLTEINRSVLDHVLFPLGSVDKPTVRKLAEELDLSIAKKKDSTGICFIGERNFKEFLTNYLPNQEGDIVDIDTNKVLGKHMGLMYYTIGQRRGLDIGGNEKRLYVVGKDLDKNVLYVSLGDDTKYLLTDEAIIEDVNFISEKRPKECTAKFRYRQSDIDVTIEYLDDGNLSVKYDNVKSVTPGQACVLYLGEECLGGGIIKEVRKDGKKLWYL